MRVLRYDEQGRVRECILTEAESIGSGYFEEYLSDGHGIAVAARLALNRMHATTGVMPSRHFIEYLSENTCRQWGDRVQVKPEWRQS